MSSPRTVVLLLLGALILLPSLAPATPYWDPAEVERRLREGKSGSDLLAPERVVPPASPAPLRENPSYIEMLGRIAEFLSIWQVDNPGDPDHGGEREGEHLPDIIQTDNTSETIWVWTRYYELTGDDQYRQNIENAWTYCMNHPAYLEEGGGSDNYGYYRMYNCGWAVRAEIKYREVYGDVTYKEYGDSCASYIANHTLAHFGNSFYDDVNTHVLAWALGNLYFAGIEGSNQGWIDHAVAEAGGKVKLWIEEEPALLGDETWAMAGGATMWGLVESYFRAHPDEIPTWLPLYKDEMDTFSSPGDFQNAWNGWYALGHRAAGVALSDPFHLGLHVSLTDFLISEDGDLDGGIPARPEDTDDQDQTWVTNYLAFMGISDILSETSTITEPDAGPLVRRLVGAPNPFDTSTRIILDLERPAELTVGIYDATGRRLALLAEGVHPAGRSTWEWDGRGANGVRLPSGVYFARISTPTATVTRRIAATR